MSARDDLADLIERNSEALLDEARRFSPALDRRYAAMSPESAALAYADDEGLADAAEEAREALYDMTYSEVLAEIETRGLDGLSKDECDTVLYSDAGCIEAGEAVMVAVLKRNGIEEARAELVKTWAKAVTDMREGV